VATKGTKNASQQKGFFAAQALTLQAGKTRAAIFLRLFRTGHASAKIRYALPRTWPPLFCLLSAEAVLLSGGNKKPCHCLGLKHRSATTRLIMLTAFA